MRQSRFEVTSRRWAISVLAVALATGIACGGDGDNGGGGSSGGGSDGGQIRNGAPIGWTQTASSQQQLQSLTFYVYVDGVQMSLPNVTCGSTPASSGGYDCTSHLPGLSPGRHVLQLTSFLNGVESPRSGSLTVTISASGQISSVVASPSQVESIDTPRSVQTNVCIAGSGECFESQVVARGIAHPRFLSSTADGRLLFIENGLAVRVIDRDVLVAEPALVPPEKGSRLVGLAVDRSAASAGTVFVAWTLHASDGTRLNITRYRELQNVLGEGATIVSGLPFPENAPAPLAVDDKGLLYVALPESDGSKAGTVLRFTREGLVPESNSRLSPILAQGYAQPTGIAIDATNHRVWLMGDQPFSISTIAVTAGTRSQWPLRPQLVVRTQHHQATSDAPGWLSLVRGVDAESSEWLWTAFNGQLSRGRIMTNGHVDPFGPVNFEPPISTHAVIQGPLDSWYVVSGTDASSASILRLNRR